MENKYYTPDISEFYVGFEYEELVEDNDLLYHWEKVKVYQCCEFDFIEDNLEHKNGDEIRVKYLDKDDIKELGFKEGKLPYQFFDGIHKLVYLGDNKISITHEADDCYLFYGVVKNKSELRKLLTQLGII